MRFFTHLFALVMLGMAALPAQGQETALEQSMLEAAELAKNTQISKANFCRSPRSNTPAKCRADYDDQFPDLALLVAKQLEYLVALKRGAPKERLDALEKAWALAKQVAKRSGDKLDELYFIETTVSTGTTGQAPKK